jgi:hypothetical protein
MSPDAGHAPLLLAVDLGLHIGLACYQVDGRLRWFRSQHFATHAALKRAVDHLLDGSPGLAHLVLEGGGQTATAWQHAARRRGIGVQRIAAEQWRQRLLLPRQQRDAQAAKHSASAAARQVIAWSGLAAPRTLQHHAAEAILLGLWGVLKLGWLRAWPAEVASARRGRRGPPTTP